MATAEAPTPPDDPETRKIIDKLAMFVAKNGPEFEAMTKTKQEGNPKFSFLHHGGPHFNYYQFRVATEQAILRSKSQPTPAPTEASSGQLKDLEEKLRESERNLKAQWDSLLSQQEAQISAAVLKASMEKVKSVAVNANLRLEEFGGTLDALAASCTKEAIATGKNWIFNNAATDIQKEVVVRFILERVKEPSASSEARLHILYLINDWAHHAMRKKQESVLKLLERYVAQLYVFSHSQATDESGKDKLQKLMALWKNHKYFSDDVFKQMENTEATVATLKSTAMTEHANLIQDIQAKVQTTYQGFQQQHQDYARHVQQQIAQLKAAQVAPPPSGGKRRSRFDQKAPPDPSLAPPVSQAPPLPPQGFGAPPPGMPPTGPWSGPPPAWNPANPPPVPPFGPPPPPNWSGPPPIPPWQPPVSGPPPFGPPVSGPPSAPLDPKDPSLTPKLPYYDLPAGLMLPLIKMEDSDYTPLKPAELRLPVPMPPPERVVNALEAFYANPSHENPRDSEGWERLGLYEYFKAKHKAIEERKKKEKAGGSTGERSRSSSSSSSSSDESPPKKRTPSPPRRRRRSPSPPRRKSRFETAEAGVDESWRTTPSEPRAEPREPKGDRFPGLGAEPDPFDQFRKHRYIRPKLKRVERIEVEMQFVRRHPPRWLQWLRLRD